MTVTATKDIRTIVDQFGRDRGRLLAIVQAVQQQFGCVSEHAIDELAKSLGIHRVEVSDMVSFYAFFTREPLGQIRIRLARTPISMMRGAGEVAAAFEHALGIRMGQTTGDGRFSLSWTSDTGMADQEPSALVNGTPLTRIAPADVKRILAALGSHAAQGTLPVFPAGDDAITALPNGHVSLGLVQAGPILFAPIHRGAGMLAAFDMTPEQVIAEVTKSRLRGRGGAGYPTGLKLNSCRQAPGSTRYIICNADEGEPGTFKDRVLLTEVPDRVFAGMTIAGYALGAREGILYLRAEYAYLWPRLQQVLALRRRDGLLGEAICGRTGCDFDIRIELGAGAYICGEESALIESLEGKRGAPRDRPPFPTERGYLGQPTVVSNVETLACITGSLEHGADWFARHGTEKSSGTKLMSVAGDCSRPGVYEAPFGISVRELLDRAGGTDAAAVQVSGPSGECIAPQDFGRRLCFEDLPTGGSTMVFGPGRDLLDIVRQFTEFFAEEACGWCVPCRVGTVVMKKMVEKVLQGRGTRHDVQELERLSHTVGRTSRCGLGQTAPNPILSTLRNFPHMWKSRIKPDEFISSFDLKQSLRTATAIESRSTSAEESA